MQRRGSGNLRYEVGWFLSDAFGDVLLVCRDDLALVGELAKMIVASWDLERWLANHWNRKTLLELHEWLTGGRWQWRASPVDQQRLDREIAQSITRALHGGKIVALRGPTRRLLDVPDRPPESRAKQGPAEHRKSPPGDVIVRVVADAPGTALPAHDYRLSVHGIDEESGLLWDRAFTGTLDGNGFLRQKTPAGATRGSLTLLGKDADGTPTELWTVELSIEELAAPDTVQGAQVRLNNLGLNAGREDGVLDERTQRAIHRFQALNDLPVQAEVKVTSTTADYLRSRHGQ